MSEVCESSIGTTPVYVDWTTGRMSGVEVGTRRKRLKDMAPMFRDNAALAAMDPGRLVYTVQYWMPVADGSPGGLFWGNTTIEPGRVGGEYFMTAGHFHATRDRAEYYFGISGEGLLLTMTRQRLVTALRMERGAALYIPGGVAHRVVNTGPAPLTFTACWPSDAGHDYASILRDGFAARVMCIDGQPALVPES